jgi:hypothetical protein
MGFAFHRPERSMQRLALPASMASGALLAGGTDSSSRLSSPGAAPDQLGGARTDSIGETPTGS